LAKLTLIPTILTVSGESINGKIGGNASPYGAGGLASRKPQNNKAIKKPIHYIPYCAVGA